MSANENHYCTCIAAADLPQSERKALTRHKAAVLRSARWQLGTAIRVRFLGGEPDLRDRVRSVALEWTELANLTFEFVEQGPTDVRIAFQAGNGSWSYLGTVCRTIPEPEPTMNYGWLKRSSSDTELRRVVLHEFGHALGLIHEHQNPQAAIKWNTAAVIHDLSGPPNHWDVATIERNMFKIYEKSAVLATDLDPDSIMMYPIPSSWTIDGFSADLNSELSHQDKVLIQQAYPR